MSRKLTQDEVNRHCSVGADTCPWCGSASIEGSAPEFFENMVAQEIICAECGAWYTEYYVMSGLTDMQSDGDSYSATNLKVVL